MKLRLGFAKKKDDGNPSSTTTTRGRDTRRSGGRGVSTLLLPLLLTNITVLLVVGAVTYLQYVFIGHERSEAVEQREAAAVAANLTGRLAGYNDVLATLGTSPAVARALVERDTAALQEQETRVRRLFPHVLRVMFIPAGAASVDETVSPPLSYACLDLVHDAEHNKLPLVEAHLYGTRVQHLDLVRPVVGPQGIVGSLLVTLDVAVVSDWLKALVADTGSYVELYQRVESNTLSLGNAGNSALQTMADSVVLPIAGTVWSLHYRSPAAQVNLTMTERSALLTVFGIGLGISLFAYGAFGAVVRRIIQRDLAAVAKQTMEMVRGHRQHNFQARLTESLAVLNGVEEQLHGLQAKVAQPNPARMAEIRQQMSLDDNPFINPET